MYDFTRTTIAMTDQAIADAFTAAHLIASEAVRAAADAYYLPVFLQELATRGVHIVNSRGLHYELADGALVAGDEYGGFSVLHPAAAPAAGASASR